MPLYNYEIGTSTASMTNVESLTTPVSPPRHYYQPYARVVDLASGGQRGVGLPVVKWQWNDYIPRAQRDQLRVYCTGATATVYIRTKTNDSTDAYGYYQAQMNWPLEEVKEAKGVRTQFEILFRVLGTATVGTGG